MALLERQSQVAPEGWGFEQMAEIHLKRGDEGMWLAMMERQLSCPDFGLEHAQARVQIARHFMPKGEYQRALPYAEAAAESWAGWAMQPAATCNEAVGNWERAELWQRRLTERYSNSRGEWYLWCLRTHWGDADAAYGAAEDDLQEVAHGQDSGGITAADLAWCYRMDDQPAEALECLRRDFRENERFWSGVQAMILANRLGQKPLRDDLRQRLVEHSRRKWKVGRQVMDLFEAGWKTGGDAVDVRAYAKLVETMEPADQLSAWAALAAFLPEMGRAAEAEPYVAKVLRQPEVANAAYRWAWMEARERGLDPVTVRGWPAPADRQTWQSPQTQPDGGTGRPKGRPSAPTSAPASPPPAPI
jgi:tetratricopeptide (TPR) repeat protein